jgi:alpha-beta hydrolase superfamily lysophospholipase
LSREIEITFPCGGLSLHGVLHLPETVRPPVVVGCHGLFSSAASLRQVEMGRLLSERGIAFFRLDHRGCGKSGGDFREVTTLEGRLEDLETVCAVLAERGDVRRPEGLFGSSMGGSVVLAHAARHGARALAVLAAPIERAPVLEILKATGEIQRLGPRFFSETDTYGLELGWNPPSRILVIHGGADQVVPPDHARRLMELSRDPKEFLFLPGGDHTLSNPEHHRLFIQKTVAWFVRWMR